MKKLFLLSLLMVGALCAKDVVKIGVILPLTGSLSEVGNDTRDAILMYKELHPAFLNCKIVFEDDQSSPKFAALAAQKLIRLDKVTGLVTFNGYAGYAVGPIAESAKVLHVAATLNRDVAKGQYSFAIYPSAESHAKIMVQALKALNFKKVGLIYGRSQGMVKIMGALKKALSEDGISYSEQSVVTTELDLRSTIMKLAEAHCDIWVDCNFPPQGEILLRQRKELGVTIPITSIIGFDHIKNKDLIEGAWYVRPALPSLSFNNSFFKKYGRAVNPLSIPGMDAFALLEKALESSNGDSMSARDYLSTNKSFEGEGGRYLLNQHNFFEGAATLVQIGGGRLIEASIQQLMKK